MQMKDLHAGDRVVLFERSQRLGGGMPAKGRYDGRTVLSRKVIAVELR